MRRSFGPAAASLASPQQLLSIEKMSEKQQKKKQNSPNTTVTTRAGDVRAKRFWKCKMQNQHVEMQDRATPGG